MRMSLGYLFVTFIAEILDLTDNFRADIRFLQFIRLYPFLARNNTSDHAGDMKKLSACTNVGGTVARRLTVL
jgi:hypothetical protein